MDVHPRAARLFALVNSSPLALVEYGMDRRIRLWNPAAERIFGWTSDEMLGRDDLPMAPPHKRTEGEDLFDRVLAGEWHAKLEELAASRGRIVAAGQVERRRLERNLHDGAGGADPEKGSGLCGLTDRVEALGGSLEIHSPPGAGTRVRATIPSRPRGG